MNINNEVTDSLWTYFTQVLDTYLITQHIVGIMNENVLNDLTHTSLTKLGPIANVGAAQVN